MIVLVVLAVVYIRAPHAQAPTAVENFFVDDVRFNQVPTVTAKIPKTWRFIAVSNGEKLNSNNLWFQDRDGTIYQLSGFTSSNQFVLNERINKLNVGN